MLLNGGPYTTASQVRQRQEVSAAAVTEAGDVAHEDLIGSEGVPIGAGGCLGHPLAIGCVDEIAVHPCQIIPAIAVRRDSATGAGVCSSPRHSSAQFAVLAVA